AELFSALDGALPGDDDPDARARKLAADTEFLLELSKDLTILPTDAADRRLRVQSILAPLFADTAPLEQFLVPEHPKDLASCHVWCDGEGSSGYDGETGSWPNQGGSATVTQSQSANRPELATGPFG